MDAVAQHVHLTKKDAVIYCTVRENCAKIVQLLQLDLLEGFFNDFNAIGLLTVTAAA